MKQLIIIFISVILCACSTVEEIGFDQVEPVAIDSPPGAMSNPEVQRIVETQLVYVEKPFYLPEPETKFLSDTDKEEISEDERVRAAFDEAAVKPMEWTGGIARYNFVEDLRYYIYTKPLYFTDIRLEPGEQFCDDIIISDSVRWVIETATSQVDGKPQSHILIKPKEEGLSCSLIFFTDRRTYYCELKSSSTYWMMGATWNYPEYRISLRGQVGTSGIFPASSPSDDLEVDPDYTIRYKGDSPPDWCPEYVYNDGRQTVIVFRKAILDEIMPGLWEGKNNLVNYTIFANKIRIPRVINCFSLKLGEEEIIIEREQENG